MSIGIIHIIINSYSHDPETWSQNVCEFISFGEAFCIGLYNNIMERERKPGYITAQGLAKV